MSIHFQFPNISAATQAEQIVQIKYYLYLLVEQLNWAFSTLETKCAAEGGTQNSLDDVSEEALAKIKHIMLDIKQRVTTLEQNLAESHSAGDTKDSGGA